MSDAAQPSTTDVQAVRAEYYERIGRSDLAPLW